MSTEQPRRLIGVFPADERERRRALFDVLEEAFPVRFEPRHPGELRDLDAVIEHWGRSQAAAAAAAEMPALSLARAEPVSAGKPAELALADSPMLASPLRGAVLPDAHLDSKPSVDSRSKLTPVPTERATVLARSGGRALWTRAGTLDCAALAPCELGSKEALRERLREGRCAALLPLVHLLLEVTRDIRWQPPPARAALLLDDPNLHWPSYGFLDLPALADHARTHGYHMALATIPLDAWFAHPTAVRSLRASAGALSLLVHGNDHNSRELGRPATEREGIALAAQALCRVEAFERRAGVRIERVMAPPHEACSEDTVRGLLRCGFEAISMTRPFPWTAPPPQSWLTRPDGADALVGWRPADLVAGGMPVLLRHPLAQRSASELALRAFLDHPLILYGHHGDLAHGLEVLDRAVAEVNALRPTRWCSLGKIAAGNYETRREGSRLHARLLGRRSRIEIPPGTNELLVELPASHGEPSKEQLKVNGEHVQLDGLVAAPLAVEPASTVEVALNRADGIDHRTLPAPHRRPLAVARRVASESRDRILPLLARVR
jgi:hypothetical protein